MMKTDLPRTGLFGHEDGTMKLLSDNDNAAALDSTSFGKNDPGNANKGVPGLVDSLAFIHGGDTAIASGRSASKDNAVFVTGPVPVSLARGIVYDANASAPTSALDRSSSSKDLTTAAAQKGYIEERTCTQNAVPCQ